MRQFFKKFLELIESQFFAKYEKDFSLRLSYALLKGYQNGFDEPKLVEEMVKSVNGMSLSDPNSSLQISTKGIFIHGNKSQVSFDYYGDPMQREFGDLIFIISVIYNGKKYFEKLTINQCKKDSSGDRKISWNLKNKGQLYLLSRFPTFRGVTGLIGKREYSLKNYSGCLGSYGLQHRPGEFIFVAAPRLSSFLGEEKILEQNQLFDLSYGIGDYPYWLAGITLPSLPWPYYEEMLHLFERWIRYHDDLPFLWPFLSDHIFGNHHYASDLYDFSSKYLTIGIGEPIYMRFGLYNTGARIFLHELLQNIRIKAVKERNENVLKLISEYYSYGYVRDMGSRDNVPPEGSEFSPEDFEGGEIGIIYTILNLGEGEE